MRASRGEIKIEEILQSAGLSFKEEYIFDDLISTSGKPLRFDFAIFNNNKLVYLIEYQGEQHFRSVDFWGGEEKFLERKKYDKMKEEYCNNMNIPLIV